jgi:transposase InsO family protein
MLRAILAGHGSESAVVHGFQRLLHHWRRQALRPVTITDAHSRYLIRCQIVSRMDLSQVRAICEAAMREYGVPARIRTDNGAPFAGTGLLGLSKLSLGLDEARDRA